MSQYTRLTVVGSERRLELVSPDDEPIAALIPQVARLLSEPTSAEAQPLALVRATGEQLDPGLSLAEQEIVSGEPLRLIRVMDAPPPPEVSDITDVVADERDQHTALFLDRHRRGLSALLLGLGTLVSLIMFGGGMPPLLQVGLFAGVAAITAALGLFRQGTLALAGCAITLGALIPVAIASSSWLNDAIPSTLRSALSILLLGWFALGVAVGLGLRVRGVLQGAVLGVLGTLGLLVPLTLGIDQAHTVTIVAVVLVLVLGLLPWWAMTSSGLTGLDDLVISGKLSDRKSVRTHVEATYTTLTWSVIALATLLILCGYLLIQEGTIWTVCAAAAIAVIAILRTRTFPLIPQIVTLWLTAFAFAVTMAFHFLHTNTTWVAVACAVTLVLALIAILVSPAPQVPARLRRLGNTLETVAVVALVPLTLGVLDIYAPLLETF